MGWETARARARPRRSVWNVRVAEVLLERDTAYGFELVQELGIASGSLYPILNRFAEYGWLGWAWERPGTYQGRPPRRWYYVTEEGRRELRKWVER